MEQPPRPDLPDPARLDAYRCAEVDALIGGLRARIEVLEQQLEVARLRHAAAVASVNEATQVAQLLGQMVLVSEAQLASDRARVDEEARSIIEAAEAAALEIATRSREAARDLLALIDELGPHEHIDLSRPPSDDEPAAHFGNAFDPFLEALRSPVLDDPAFGPVREPI
jgi:cell division septum initiation protein DivIVA